MGDCNNKVLRYLVGLELLPARIGQGTLTAFVLLPASGPVTFIELEYHDTDRH